MLNCPVKTKFLEGGKPHKSKGLSSSKKMQGKDLKDIGSLKGGEGIYIWVIEP